MLPFAAAVILTMVLWRMGRDANRVAPALQTQESFRLAPRFELYDQHSQLVKFERYLGRTELLVLFLGEAEPGGHRWVEALQDQATRLEDLGMQILVVCLVTPAVVRQSEQDRREPFPFPILTDVTLRLAEPAPVHRLWGLWDDQRGTPRVAVFRVRRDGMVAWEDGAPRAEPDPDELFRSLVR